ncbi:cystathionine beta-synthase, partial [Escherichia coli]|nr:cystathionine beta-synthase [Escherichia coli]
IGEALAKQGTATVPLDTTLAEAAKALREQGDDALVVATAPLPARIGEIRGVIGASDITDALLAGAEPTSTLADLGDLAMPFIGTADTPEHAQDLLKSHPAVLLTKGGEVIAAATAADLLAYT